MRCGGDGPIVAPGHAACAAAGGQGLMCMCALPRAAAPVCAHGAMQPAHRQEYDFDDMLHAALCVCVWTCARRLHRQRQRRAPQQRRRAPIPMSWRQHGWHQPRGGCRPGHSPGGWLACGRVAATAACLPARPSACLPTHPLARMPACLHWRCTRDAALAGVSP